MRLAVTYENGNVFPHFGKTKNFKLYDIEDGKVVSSEIMDCGGTGHEALAGLLSEHGVTTLICGGLGGGAQAALAEAGITVISGAAGDTDQAVESYMAGNLESQGVNCDHHDHEHGEGHHHNHDGGCHGHGEEHHGGCHGHGDNNESAMSHDEGGYDSYGGDSCGGCGSDEESGCGGCGSDDEGCGSGCGGCSGCGHHEMMIIYDGKNAGKVCRVHYTGTLDDGSKFDSSYDRNQPLEFVSGVGMMIEGFDKAVVDMEVGQEIDIHLDPAQAYGDVDPDAIIKSLIADIPGSEELTVGQELYLQGEDGRPFPVVVTEKDDKEIVFDANHKLAGKALNFHIELLSAEDM